MELGREGFEGFEDGERVDGAWFPGCGKEWCFARDSRAFRDVTGGEYAEALTWYGFDGV